MAVSAKPATVSAAPRRVGQALNAGRAYRRICRLLILALSVFFLATVALFVLAAMHGALPGYGLHFALLFGAWALSAVVVAIFLCMKRARLDRNASFAFRLALLTTYARGLLHTAYREREAALRALPGGDSLTELALMVVTRYELTNEEMQLAPGSSLPAVNRMVGDRYAALLDFMLEEPDQAAHLLTLYREYDRLIEQWLRLHLPGYAACHRPLLERNAWCLRCRVLLEFCDFLAAEGTETYPDLIPSIAYYADPEHGEDVPRRIPKAEQYARYREIRAAIEAVDGVDGHLSMHGEGLAALGAAIESYEQYVADYTLAGEPPLDISRYRTIHAEAKGDKSVCFRCGRERPTRYRGVCSRCGHYVCPRCGACFCKKRIAHGR